jgi:hypothetical protein
MATLGRNSALAMVAVLALHASSVLALHASSVQFNSTIFPYSLLQPSAFRHVILPTDPLKVDYFFPNLGSYTTNVNVYAERQQDDPDDAKFLHDYGGKHVRKDGTITIMGKKLEFTRADFKSVTGRWIEDRVSFLADGLVWHLTMSYDVKYRSMRPVMVRMLESFRLRPTSTPDL